MRRIVSAFGILAATLLAATPAFAGIASPAMSYVDSFFVACPAGDLVFHVISRDAAGTPEVDHDLDVELCPCGAAVVCPAIDADAYAIVGCTIRTTNQNRLTGAADFPIRGGGACDLAAVRVWSGGVLLRSLIGAASPDQDGDLVVGPGDRALLEARILTGTYAAGADLDGDRQVDAADLALLEQHMGHACDTALPALPRSWGSIKTRYR